jgi:hypothetical protein
MGNIDKKLEKIIRKNSINTEKLKAVLLTRKLSYNMILVVWAGIIGIGGIIVYFLSLSDKNSEQTPIPEVALPVFILCTIIFIFNLVAFIEKPIVYLYEDGFMTSREKEKILYKTFDYHYTSGTSEGNIHKFCYRGKNDEWFSLSLYVPVDIRGMIVKDYLDMILPWKIDEIEKGYEEKFIIKKKKQEILELITGIASMLPLIGAVFEKIIPENSEKIYTSLKNEILLTKNYIKIEDKIYSCSENRIFINKYRNLIISDLNDRIVEQIFLNSITRPDLLAALVNHFYGEEK